MINSIRNWDEFERRVCSIIYKINPSNISRYDGGADRGRDIVFELNDGDINFKIIVECKYYDKGITKSVIAPALDWAKIHRPDLLYYWVVPYLTPDTKDYIESFSREYNISVLYEEEINIAEYVNFYSDDENIVWKTLRNKIIRACRHTNNQYRLFAFESQQHSNYDQPYLIDRELERTELINSSSRAFFIQGISACGKTQLMRYISYLYTKKKHCVIWYTVRNENRDIQCESFFCTFSEFFASVYHDTVLKSYFMEFGNYLSRELENMFIGLLEKYHPILFIDDVHNCQRDNSTLRSLFEKIIEFSACKIYFAGWMNIFSSRLISQKKLSLIILNGLDAKYLNQIIIHYSGYENPEIAGLIADRFHGLPGYAVLVDKNTVVSDLSDDKQFFYSFLKFLTDKEQALLFSLVYATVDISADYLCKNGFFLELESLDNKHLVVNRGDYYTVHDKYRPFFYAYPVENTVFEAAIKIMLNYSMLDSSLYFDIIAAYIERNELSKAWSVLSGNFKILLHCQQNARLLSFLQTIEKNNGGNIDDNDLILKKITLLERVGEFDLCLKYIQLLGGNELFSDTEKQSLLYIYFRSMYFTNQYDALLQAYKDSSDAIFSSTSPEFQSQMLLIVGRVYYIRGLLNGALACYMLSYQLAFQAKDKALQVKAIHRLSMVECAFGMIKESQKTFEVLARLSNYITPKRRSYIFYRIAKCEMLKGHYSKAEEYNKKSIRIKTSYSDIRGIVFSNKLAAEISLSRKEYLDAVCYIKQALDGADKIKLNKEWLACTLIKIKIMLESHKDMDSQLLWQDFMRCLDIASQEKLLYRLKTICHLSKYFFEDIYNAAESKYNALSDELLDDEQLLISSCTQKMNRYYKSIFEEAMQERKVVTPVLMLQSGFVELEND